jgi:hypothetical protein
MMGRKKPSFYLLPIRNLLLLSIFTCKDIEAVGWMFSRFVGRHPHVVNRAVLWRKMGLRCDEANHGREDKEPTPAS